MNVDKPLTEAELRRANKKANKERKPLSGINIVALRNANRADSEFKPLVETLTESKKRELRKAVRNGNGK